MHEKTIRIAAIFLILRISHSIVVPEVYPEQIHISLGKTPREIVVTWLTFLNTGTPIVQYKAVTEGLAHTVEGSSTTFVDGGEGQSIRFIHKVVLQVLPDTYYVYRCGSAYGTSEQRVFKVSPEGVEWSPRLVIYGDMGWQGAETFPYIANEVRESDVDAVVHVGDIAYNMDSYDGFIGDQFMRMIEPVASCTPYMTIPGNHEQAYNFSHYKNRFSMPGDSEGLFYSFDLGPAHFVALSTEVYYFPNYGVESVISQYNWLQNDLKKATKSKNKSLRPWIIVFTHRPLYCSSDTKEDCSLPTSVLKCYILNSCNYGLEDLFHKYKVDVIFSGHMHYYERSFPLYKNKVHNSTRCNSYKNPGAVVHIITGAAGMQSGTEKASHIRSDWFPFYSREYSYTVLTVVNKTHIYTEQKSADRDGKIMDWLWIIKDIK